MNCYFLPKKLAVAITPFWYRRFREKGVLDVDRAICKFLIQNFKNFKTTFKYSVNYTAGSTDNSVKKEFFLQGNEQLKKKYILTGRPWVKGEDCIPIKY